MTRIPLRRPTDKLAGCMWLARLTEKIRIHSAGELDRNYLMPFCNRRATDGIFLAHFGLAKDEIIQVVQASNGDDKKVATWFLAKGPDVADKITAWNTIAPNIGRSGFPGEQMITLAKKYFCTEPIDPRLDSIFLLIAADEGFLNEALADQAAKTDSCQ